MTIDIEHERSLNSNTAAVAAATTAATGTGNIIATGGDTSWPFEFLRRSGRCPECAAQSLRFEADSVACASCGSTYPVLKGKPVLIRPGNDVFPPSGYAHLEVAAPRPMPPLKRVARALYAALPSPSVDLGTGKHLAAMADEMRAFKDPVILVVGGGLQRERLNRIFEASGTRLFYTDVDVSADVDIFCDGHDLPFADGSVQGIITMAVLEHVLYPERAVAEIHRVLAPNGVVYSAIPFVQCVHAGAYDFTRYTMGGHRRLYNHFTELNGGVLGGPGTALLWQIEHTAACVFDIPRVRTVARLFFRLLFLWVKYLDLIVKNRASAVDAAAATFFFGRRSDTVATDANIIERYGMRRNSRGYAPRAE